MSSKYSKTEEMHRFSPETGLDIITISQNNNSPMKRDCAAIVGKIKKFSDEKGLSRQWEFSQNGKKCHKIRLATIPEGMAIILQTVDALSVPRPTLAHGDWLLREGVPRRVVVFP